MSYMVKSGAKSIGIVKKKSKKSLNSVLARQYLRENKVSVLKVGTTKRRKKR